MSALSKIKSRESKKGFISILRGAACLIAAAVVLFTNYTAGLLDSKWAVWGIAGVLVVYGLGKVFGGWIKIASNKSTGSEPFFGQLVMKAPKESLKNETEKYAFLVYGFYESSEVMYNGDKPLAELKKDPYYCSEDMLKYNEALALNDFYGMYNDLEFRKKDALANAWDINNAEDAREAISSLFENAVESANIPLTAYPNVDDLTDSIVELGFDVKGLDRTQINASGFDLVRTIWVARTSYVAGYINADELRDIAHNVALFTAANYESWQHLAYSYLATYIAWAENADGVLYSFVAERVHAVKQYVSTPYSPLAGTSLDELRAYFEATSPKETQSKEN